MRGSERFAVPGQGEARAQQPVRWKFTFSVTSTGFTIGVAFELTFAKAFPISLSPPPLLRRALPPVAAVVAEEAEVGAAAAAAVAASE